MMFRRLLPFLCSLILLGAGPVWAQSTGRAPVMVEGKTSLPLRVLTRPMANLHEAADAGSPVVEGNLPTFSNFYVYAQPGGESAASGLGWYEVGRDDQGQTAGWLSAEDVFEWRQTMCLAYTTPHGRNQVLMFENHRNLKELLGKSPEERTAEAGQLYEAIQSGELPADFPVLSVEPKLAVDITEQFYLLPILDFEAIEVDGREGRLLELAAVVAGGEGARVKSDIRENAEYLSGANLEAGQAAGQVGGDLMVDIVWAVDTTVSMAPYIDRTREVVTEVSKRLAENPELSRKLKFGLWGYRDPVEDIPEIEYTTKNFTPELRDIGDFVQSMAEVQETKIDSVDFPEDLFSGLSDALLNTAWRPNSMKMIILVGDAPGHELGHKWNLSGYDAEKLRLLANEKNATIQAIQVRPQGARRYQRLAEEQFLTLALNKGTDNSLYYDIDSSELEGFGRATDMVVASVVSLVEKAESLAAPAEASAPPLSGEQAALLEDYEEDDPAAAGLTDKEKELKANLDQALQAALVEWLGSRTQAQAPRDIVAWAVDKDLLEPDKPSLEVRLLINKRQLDSLSTLLSGVIEAGRTSEVTGDDFFTALQATSAMASRDPDSMSQAASLAENGLIPEFLDGLPYHSRLMDLDNDLWSSLSPDEQDAFVNSLEAGIMVYQSLHDDPASWVALNPGDDADEMVYPIPLDLLP